MSVVEHITADQGLFLLALTEDDPERTRAFEHAAQCETCQAILNDSTRALALLDEGLAELPALDPALAARVHAAVQSSQRSPAAWLGIALGAAATLFLAWFAEHHSVSQAHHSGLRCFLFEQAFAGGAFALGLVYAAQERGRIGNLQWATIAMTGALAGQAALLLRCNANGAAVHILASHVLGVGFATVLGALAGRLRSVG